MTDLPTIAPGERIYAIGDIHGRLDLFKKLVRLIREDAISRDVRPTRLILLGDIIDRGPRSADLVDLLRRLTADSDQLVVLKGNHEETMVKALRGDVAAMKMWLQFGGDKALMSWGVPPSALSEPFPVMIKIARRHIKAPVLHWLDELPMAHISGDYLFVHAGIKPGVSLEMQRPEDMLWIRGEFTQSAVQHPAIVVHGHSIVEGEPEFHSNRIAVDTGAYMSGLLSAVGFEDDRRWVLTTDSWSGEMVQAEPIGRG